MTVARRAVIGFAVVFLVAVSSCLAVWWQAGTARERLVGYRSSEARLDDAMWSIRADFYNYDDQMNMYVAVLAVGRTADLKLAETTYQQAVDARGRLGQDLATARRLAHDPAVLALIDRLGTDVAGYGGFADQTRAAARAGDVQRAVYLSTVGNLGPSDDMMPTLDSASSKVRSAAERTLSQVEAEQRRMEVIAAASGAVIALLLVALAIGLRVWVLAPVTWLRTSMADIAEGRRARTDLLAVRGHDEFGAVATAFNTMLSALADQDAELQQASVARERGMQAGFEQQRAAEQMVRTRAQSVVDETAGTVRQDLEELMASVQLVREAADTIDVKVESADSVTQVVIENARRADEVVTALEVSLHRVAGMTELIAGVADQTKLLALNATIEAARAGTAGRGFSVVADEVKQLATTTARSTGEIVTTISSLERDAGAMTSAISAMSDALGGVDEATGALKDVAQAQHALVERLTAKVTASIEKIDGMATLADRLERRQHARVPVSGTVRLRGPGGVLEGEFGDLSEGGLLCRCARPTGLRAGTLVDLDFEIGGQRFSQRCQVVTTGTTDTEVRLQFVNATPALIKIARRIAGG